jgi:hypothetical protein
MADDPNDQTPPSVAAEATPVPRRSHIQPVGEIAAAARHSETLGLRLARASEVLRQQLALARGAGLVVEEVTPGSIADKAGFRQHDVLVLLDDQMLLLPEQLAALLEASNGATTSACTLLRAGAKVTITLAEPRQTGKPALSVPSMPLSSPTVGTAQTPARPQLPTVRQTAAKPSASPRLRAPASALALVQQDRSVQQTQATVQASAEVPAAPSAQTAGRRAASADETLVRHDPDYQIKLSRGNETRLVVLDPRGGIVFNDEIDTPEHRSLVPAAVRQRVEQMEKSLEAVTNGPAVEIGRLDAAPIEIR